MSFEIDTAHLAEALHQEEKSFLMGQYASLLVQDLEQNGDAVLDRRAVQALRTARPYAGAALSARIDRLLAGRGEMAHAASETASDAEDDLDEDREPEEEEEEGEGLFDEEPEAEAETETVEDEDDLGEETGLFDEEEGSEPLGTDRDQTADVDLEAEEPEADETPVGRGARPGRGGAAAPGHALEETPDFTLDQEAEDEDSLGFSTEGHQQRRTAGFVPRKGHEREETPRFDPKAGHEQEETPGLVAKKGRARKGTPGFVPTEGHQREDTPGFDPKTGHEQEETPGFVATEGHQQRQTAGFIPKKGHEREETPGFVPKERDEEGEDDRGFVPAEGHQRRQTAGLIPKAGHEQEETPGFTPTRGHELEPRTSRPRGGRPSSDEEAESDPRRRRASRDRQRSRREASEETGSDDPGEALFGGDGETDGDQDEDQGAAGAKPAKPRARGRRPSGGSPAEDQPQGKAKPGRRKPEGTTSDDDAREREAKAREELERRRQAREAERQQRSQRLGQRTLFPGQTEAGPREDGQTDAAERRRPGREEEPQDAEADQAEAAEIDDLLAGLSYSISLEDLEQYLDIRIPAEDRLLLDRRYALKTRETTVRSLLRQMATSGVNYALIPRLSRLVRQGQETRITAASLLRAQPQLFENVQQIIVKYRAEPFFVKDSPSVDWALVACEALPESLDRNFSQQRQVIKQYAQGYQATERRIGRRRLVEALYDLIVVQMVHKEGMLSRTVDLTDSKVGRQNMVFINYGASGIRISDISRMESHPQLGICPSW